MSTPTRWGRVAALVGGVALVGLAGCSKSSDNGNKGSAESTTPSKARAEAPPAPPTIKPKVAAQPTPAKAGPARSRNETAEYVIEIVPPAKVSAGAETAVTVKVRPKTDAGWHFNLDFPTSLKVQAPAGMTVAKAKQSLEDAVEKSEDEGATWSVQVTPEKAGSGTLTCDVKFAVCTETTCDPKKETLALQLDAK